MFGEDLVDRGETSAALLLLPALPETASRLLRGGDCVFEPSVFLRHAMPQFGI